ncbi:MAG: hypothetical protein R3337_00330 [Gammaproteobacteria bacterium]|nr:hypothetical protein [Gammaproteobacteria bacterium]
MNFEDEHYVRVYTRDTKTWKRLGFEGQCVLLFLLRRLDKAGVLDDIEEPVADVALLTEVPESIVEAGLPKLLACGVLQHRGEFIVMPRYIEGQTAKKSDKVRAKESRDRRRASAMLSQIVTESHETEEGVTSCDASERGVTQVNAITERDGADTNRDPASQSVTERHDGPGERHSTQYNAVQRNAATATAVGEQQQFPSSMAEAMPIPIQGRAQLVLDHEHTAAWLTPHRWPELEAVARASNRARGRSAEPRLLSYPEKNTKRLVELFAARYTQAQLETAVGSEWWSKSKLGLQSLTPNIVDRANQAGRSEADEAERRRAKAKAAREAMDRQAAEQSARYAAGGSQ